jgi:hypothetical protein
MGKDFDDFLKDDKKVDEVMNYVFKSSPYKDIDLQMKILLNSLGDIFTEKLSDDEIVAQISICNNITEMARERREEEAASELFD